MSNTALQQAIEAADDQRYQAMFKLDYAAMETVFGDDLAYTHSSSVTDSKASYIAAMKSGKYRYKTAQREAVTVRGYGDLALMHGRVTIEVDVDGAPRTLRNCFINAWAHRNGVWQMVHWQSTPIPQPAK